MRLQKPLRVRRTMGVRDSLVLPRMRAEGNKREGLQVKGTEDKVTSVMVEIC